MHIRENSRQSLRPESSKLFLRLFAAHISPVFSLRQRDPVLQKSFGIFDAHVAAQRNRIHAWAAKLRFWAQTTEISRVAPVGDHDIVQLQNIVFISDSRHRRFISPLATLSKRTD
jgi:hypothetical protein